MLGCFTRVVRLELDSFPIHSPFQVLVLILVAQLALVAMDRAGRLFSRAGSPPAIPLGQHSPQQSAQQQQQQQQAPGSPQSIHSVDQPQQQAGNQHLDSLFRNIGQQQAQPQYTSQGQQQPPPQSGTASSTPLSHTSGANAQQTSAEKQSALLSTLYGSPQSQPLSPISLHNMSQQERAPSPSPSQRSVEADNPGKMLLETLMAGCVHISLCAWLARVPAACPSPNLAAHILHICHLGRALGKINAFPLPRLYCTAMSC